jgi:hypothetical protein
MEFERPHFEGGSAELRDKLNRLVSDLYRSLNIRTDGIICQAKSPTGISLRLDIPALMQQLPQLYGSGGGGPVATVYCKVMQIPVYNDPTKAKFVVQIANIDTVVGSQTYQQWVGNGTDIQIERALGFEGFLDGGNNDCKDIRNWFPWPNVNSIVPLITKWDYENFVGQTRTPMTRYYMNVDMMYGGPEDIASIRQNPLFVHSTYYRNIVQAVWV